MSSYQAISQAISDAERDLDGVVGSQIPTIPNTLKIAAFNPQTISTVTKLLAVLSQYPIDQLLDAMTFVHTSPRPKLVRILKITLILAKIMKPFANLFFSKSGINWSTVIPILEELIKHLIDLSDGE